MESILAPDLRDWLKLTGWHDIDYREKKLAEYRSTDAGEQKHQMAKAERTDAGKNDRGSTGSTEAHRHIGSRVGYRDPVVSKPRARSISPYHRDPDRYRIRAYPRFRDDDYDRQMAPRGPPLHYITRPTRDPAHFTDRIENYDGPNRDPVDDQRDLTRELMNLRSPSRLVLKDKGEVCFFVMKSYCWSHVYDSMEDGLWATQHSSADAISKAFSSGKMVVLFFAVNKSHGMQGYALMKSLPSADIRHPRWWYGVRWQISEPFQVEWMNTMHVDSKHILHIKNNLNEDLPVTRARNCQEIDENAGREMVRILESRGIEEYKRAKQSGSLSRQ
ncbi:YTH-domain-containing protein [Daldinia caldariorum]|uniref:YTH-domain-containing protein n=1 Tax=Daldinia caldariorum TaxID=326644 RepID=UPI00200744A7|nr:YTH-domain-containing protein [Daldinia caldariorum]KAI1473122.1 YTH-domain-containing protein [Daldinia caldariorum]